jgi:exopolysaccharide/PEP-CTERM locus tyrosine autokinase
LGKIFDALDKHFREQQVGPEGLRPENADYKDLLYCDNQSWKLDINDRSIFDDQKTIEHLIENKLIQPDGKLTAKGKKAYKELIADLRVAMAGLYQGDSQPENEGILKKNFDDESQDGVDNSNAGAKRQFAVYDHRSEDDSQADSDDEEDEQSASIAKSDDADVDEENSGQKSLRVAYIKQDDDGDDSAQEKVADQKEDELPSEDTAAEHSAKDRNDSTGPTKVSSIDKNMVSILADQSFEAEQFKILRSNILFPHSGKSPRTVLVTSAEQGDGKSFVAANLAVSIALSMNHHALLVDCDLRNPTVHKMFGFEIERGLSQYLNDGVPLESLIFRTKVERLSVVPAGKIPMNPSELLSSNKMVDLINEVRSRFNDRIIIIDSPPTELTSEPAVLARSVDGVIITVRYGKTSTRSLKKMIDVIGKDKILGSVLNRFEYAITDYYYGYKSYRKYGAYRKRD